MNTNKESSFVLHDYSNYMSLPVGTDWSTPNWKSQKTGRKARRRLSNAPKAVRKRMGFKERRG